MCMHIRMDINWQMTKKPGMKIMSCVHGSQKHAHPVEEAAEEG